MSDVKLNSAPTTSKDAVAVAEKPVLTKTKVPSNAPVNKDPFAANEKGPSDWTLEAGEDDQVIGRNSLTGREFVGTMKEFNAKLRG